MSLYCIVHHTTATYLCKIQHILHVTQTISSNDYKIHSLFYSYIQQFQGLTVCVEEGKVTVARILIDSIIDKQGLLRPGDVIVEANGQKIKNPEQLQEVCWLY